MSEEEPWTVERYFAYLGMRQPSPAPCVRMSVTPPPSEPVARPKYKSKLEEAWAQVLTWRQQAGELVRWDYEPVSLKIAEGCRYTPDFLSVTSDGRCVYAEVKGWMREAARVRLHVAAQRYRQWEFWLVTRDKQGQWHEERVPV